MIKILSNLTIKEYFLNLIKKKKTTNILTANNIASGEKLGVFLLRSKTWQR
jgi:hypothetical protein